MENNFPQQQARSTLDIPSTSRLRFSSGTKVGPSTLTSPARVRRPSMAYAHADSHHGFERLFEIELEEGEVVPWWTSRRLLLSVLCFVGFFCLYALRVNLSTAIVCMIKNKPASNTTTGNSSIQSNATKDTCPTYHGGTKHEGDFMWSKESQGLLLGAFFWGYMSCQVASGIFSDRYGPRLMITIGMFPAAVITILLPVLARGSIYWMLVGRVLIGCGEAMMYPGMQSLWSKWSPPHERSRLVGFAFGGTQLGNAVTFPVAALLCAYGFDGGWPSVFYVTGMLCLVWCFVYTYYSRDSPGEMPGISDSEKKYIEMSLGVYGLSVEELKRRRGTLMKPWGKILSSPAVWGIVFAHTFGNYGAYMLLTMMPTYMKEVLKFDIKANGAYSMIPYLVFWIFIIISAQIADMIISKKWLSIEWTRKLMCAIGMIIPSIFLVWTGYMDCHQQLEAVVLLSLSMGFCGFQFSSFFVNHADIAPRYAGTLFGLSNMCASIPGIIAPYIVGAITKDGTREEWLVAFYIAAAIQVSGFILFTILAKGEIQDWAKEDATPKDNLPLEGIKEEDEEKHA